MTTHADDGRRVVVRFRDGRVLKGTTHDFAPNKERFHLAPGGDDRVKPVEVPVAALKAVFFVKSWEGDPRRVDDNSFERAMGQGRRMLVTFSDGEIIAGFTMGYTPDKPGFFLIPADGASNNARVFVVSASVKKIQWATTSSPAFAVAAGNPGLRS